MRLVLVIAVLAASATSAHAGDRYGSTVAARGNAAGAAPYAGPMLTWSGKAPPPVPQTPPSMVAGPPTMLPGGLYRPTAASPAPMTRVPAVQTPMVQAPTPRPGAAYAGVAPGAAPQSLYSRPVTGAPAPVAALAPPPGPVPALGGLYATNAPRFYSVHRAYGETPDPIPMPPPGDRAAFRPEASLAGAVALSGVGDGVLKDDAGDDDSMAGVGASEEADEAARSAKREAERTAARRAAASPGAGK